MDNIGRIRLKHAAWLAGLEKHVKEDIAQLGKQANTSFLQEAQVVEIQRLKAELGDGYKYLAQLYMEPLRFKRTAEKEKSAKDAEMGMEDMADFDILPDVDQQLVHLGAFEQETDTHAIRKMRCKSWGSLVAKTTDYYFSISSRGSTVALGGLDHIMQINIKRNMVTKSPRTPKPVIKVFYQSKQCILGGRIDGTVCFYNPLTNNLKEIECHRNKVVGFKSVTEQTALSASDKSWCLIDCNAEKVLRSKVGLKSINHCSALFGTRNILVSSKTESLVQVWDLNAASVAMELKVPNVKMAEHLFIGTACLITINNNDIQVFDLRCLERPIQEWKDKEPKTVHSGRQANVAAVCGNDIRLVGYAERDSSEILHNILPFQAADIKDVCENEASRYVNFLESKENGSTLHTCFYKI